MKLKLDKYKILQPTKLLKWLIIKMKWSWIYTKKINPFANQSPFGKYTISIVKNKFVIQLITM